MGNAQRGYRERALLRQKALAKVELAKAIAAANARFNKTMARSVAEDEAPAKRQKSEDFSFDDADESRPLSGLLALDKFMKSMRMTIDKSLYIDFASMSKERLDQLQVLGVGSATSKRLSTSTVLVTSASEADVKILTHDYEAISSGFLYSYIKLSSESAFPNAMDRVKDRLAWWQWLTDFFGQNSGHRQIHPRIYAQAPRGAFLDASD